MGIEINRVVILSGAPNYSKEFLLSEIGQDDFVIGVDFGTKIAKEIGINLSLAVGDFDTAPLAVGDFETIRLPSEKDCTDTMFACEEAVRRGYKKIVLLNAIGSRVDHTYANFLCLNYLFENGIDASIKNQRTLAYIIDKRISVQKTNYKFLSMFALGGDVFGLTLRGMKYPLTNHSLSVFSPLCISNEIVGNTGEILLSSGKLLIIQAND